MFRTKEKLTAILVAIVTFAATLLLGFATLLGMPQKVSTAKAATTQYVKVTSAPTDWSGTYLIVYETDGLAFNGGLSTLDAVGNTIDVTINNNTIASTTATDNATFTIAKSGTSYTIKSKSGKYIGRTADKNKIDESTSTKYLNTISFNTDKTVEIIGSGKPHLRYNASDARFRYYRSDTYSKQQPICLYRKETVTTCEHTNENSTVTKSATCTEAGTTTFTCADCGQTRTETIPATGHSYNEGEVTKEPTATETGIRLYTCQRENCGETYEEILPTTTLYTVIFSVLGNTQAIESENVGAGALITLPTPDGLPMGVSFVGWTTNKDATTADDVLTGNYTVKEDKTLYALISYASGEAVTLYEKVTEAPADWSGKYLIVYETDKVAFDGGLSTLDAVGNTIDVTINNNTIASTTATDNATFTIAKSGTSYTIKSASGYYIGKTASGNGLNTNQSTQYTNTLSVAGGDITIKASGGSILRFNNAENQMRFRYYGSGQQAIQLYKFVTKQNFTYTTTLAKFNSASLTIGTDLTMNYYATVDGVYTDLKAQFTIAGDVIEVEGEYDTKTGRYVFSLALPPQCMADNISAVLLSGETEIAWANNYSVRTYAINSLNKTTSNELKALLYELLRYGAAAQQYTGYNTGDLATKDVPMDDVADVNATNKYNLINHIENGTADDYPVYITAVGVRFENVNKIYVKFNATAENVSVRISRGDVENSVEVGTFALNDTILYTNEIYATAFDEVFTFEVFVGETKTQTLTYSVNSYVANRVAAGSTDAMTDLAKALYLYGEAAKAYAPFAN